MSQSAVLLMFTIGMGIDNASCRIQIGNFITKVKDHRHFQNSFKSSNNKIHKTKSLLIPYATILPLLTLNYIMLQSMPMDIDFFFLINPGPPATSTITESQHPIPRQVIFSSLFNKTKRLQLKFIRFKHHLINFKFYKEKHFIPKSLLPRRSPLPSSRYSFYKT